MYVENRQATKGNVMKYLVSFFALLSAIVTASGCATVMHGKTQPIGITSTPNRADVIVDQALVGVTPLIVEMARDTNHLVLIRKEGYHPYSTFVTQSVSGAVAGNIVTGGLIGGAIDKSTGAMYKLSPSNINAILKKSDAPVQMAKLSAIARILYPPRIVGSGTDHWIRKPELYTGETAKIILDVSTSGVMHVDDISARVIGAHDGLKISHSTRIKTVMPGETGRVRLLATSDGTVGNKMVNIHVEIFANGVKSDTLTLGIVCRNK
jgi:PEGA domain-containing protein